MDDFRPISTETLSDAWGTLTRHRFALRLRDGSWQEQVREVYDRGHGAAALLHDPEADTVLLVRQFRLPLKVTGQDPYPIEAPAGLLEQADPAERMRAELMEETGYEARGLTHVTDLVMTPGSVTETIACFAGEYRRGERTGAGGGNDEEGEDIEVLHIPLPEAFEMVRDGRISDAKTVVLIQHLVLSRAVPPGAGIG